MNHLAVMELLTIRPGENLEKKTKEKAEKRAFTLSDRTFRLIVYLREIKKQKMAPPGLVTVALLQ